MKMLITSTFSYAVSPPRDVDGLFQICLVYDLSPKWKVRTHKFSGIDVTGSSGDIDV